MSKEVFALGVFPKVIPEFMLPLYPELLFLFKITLIIPDIPSGLYFAEGLVINSICFIDDEGICCNN